MRQDQSPKLRPYEAAQILGVQPQTLRIWEKQGKLHPTRTVGNRRRFDRAEVEALAVQRQAA